MSRPRIDMNISVAEGVAIDAIPYFGRETKQWRLGGVGGETKGSMVSACRGQKQWERTYAAFALAGRYFFELSTFAFFLRSLAFFPAILSKVFTFSHGFPCGAAGKKR